MKVLTNTKSSKGPLVEQRQIASKSTEMKIITGPFKEYEKKGKKSPTNTIICAWHLDISRNYICIYNLHFQQ